DLLTVLNLQFIANLHRTAGLSLTPINPNPSLLGHILGNGAALDQSRYLEKLIKSHPYLIASFSLLPALNAGTVDSGILISSPVCGLRPTRPARLRVSNVPKPINCTLSPLD